MDAHPGALDVIIVSPGLPHHGGTLAERSLGGSETAAIYVAKALAARGHQVTVFSPGGSGIHDRVQYQPIESAAHYGATVPHDVCVISRVLDFCLVPSLSKIKVLWCHDLALKRAKGQMQGVLYSLDAVYVLSPFQRRQYAEVHGITDALVLTRNGIDLKAFAGLEKLRRDPTKLVYGSRPERGLETALNVMARLGAAGSPLKLHLAWYDNTPPQVADYYKMLWSRAEQMPNVKLLGPLKQAEWHRELATARALIYPGCAGDFREISGIVFMEAMATGTPIVACARGAVVDTVLPQCGLLVGDEGSDVGAEPYQQAFVAAVEQVATDDIAWRSMSFAGRERATILDWSEVAAQWEQDWRERIEASQANPYRLRRHLERIGDWEVLRCVTSSSPAEPDSSDSRLSAPSRSAASGSS